MKPAISLLPMALVCGLSLAASAWGQAGDAGTPAESLNRAFSAEWRDEAAGWTELHWAAALDRPDAVAALVEAGMAPDVRLGAGRPLEGRRRALRRISATAAGGARPRRRL